VVSPGSPLDDDPSPSLELPSLVAAVVVDSSPAEPLPSSFPIVVTPVVVGVLPPSSPPHAQTVQARARTRVGRTRRG
jgi:hypothetical protein